ncbi:MAG: hypothetical protein ACLQEQ_04565 [Nitrososphaerales archaeon]
MSEAQDSSVWWRVNSALEVKNVYLFGFHLSPRTLLLTLSSLAVGAVVTLPFSLALIVKAGVLGTFTLAGFVVSSKRIKMTPLELVILYRFTQYGGRPKQVSARPIEEEHPMEDKGSVDMMPIEDFTKPTPYNIGGRLRVQKPTKLSLLLDSRQLSECTVTPTSSEYWFLYKPEAKDIGTHDLTIKAEGMAEPIFQKSIAVFPKGKEMLLEQVKK